MPYVYIILYAVCFTRAIPEQLAGVPCAQGKGCCCVARAIFLLLQTRQNHMDPEAITLNDETVGINQQKLL